MLFIYTENCAARKHAEKKYIKCEPDTPQCLRIKNKPILMNIKTRYFQIHITFSLYE